MKGQTAYRTCYLTAGAIVLLSTLLASLFTLGDQYFLGNLPNDWLIHYLAKPVVWMVVLSMIPVLVAGAWYKNQLER